MFATIVIDLDPNLFQVGPFLITWHGVFSVLGILAAARVAQILLKPEGISADRVYDLAVWMVIAGLIGARLLYVWENYRQFGGAWQKIVFINEGGLSQWGGIFGGLIGAFLWCWQSKVDYRLFLDAAGPANALGFAIGRIGDIINGEHHAIDSNLPFAVQYVNERTLGEPGRTVHPEVAYELVFNAIVFGTAILTYRWFKRRLPVGVTGLIWLSVYATGRFALSFLRKDSLVLGLRQAQWASLTMVAVSLVIIAIWMLRTGRAAPPEESAKPEDVEQEEATA
ncbi:MAG TPA: prolipoprotein diacylglyceryl transferase [Candidatus Dormibacteraeota bacterium]|nr:prolipoprotein diacylglyceryl transferase [Candidatus Dormibacteraeota bacterium]